MHRTLFSVGLVISAASKPKEEEQRVCDEIALRLKAGVRIYQICKATQPSNSHQPTETVFYDYFTNELVSRVEVHVYIIMANDVALLSAFSKLLSHQENSTHESLFILTPRNYWGGLLTWFKEVALRRGMITSEILDRIELVDGAEGIVEHVFSYREPACI